jgi:Lipocalin-like domain
MKHSILRGLIPLCVGVAISASMSAGQDRAGSGTASDRLAGAWRLASLEQPGQDGQLHQIECEGMLVATRDGHISIQVMDRNSQAQKVPGSEQYSQRGYEASYGTYVVDEGAHTFTFHVEGALVRSLIGKDLPRAYELSGRELIVKSTRADEHWRVTWERYQ